MAAVVLISSASFALKPPKPALLTPAKDSTGLDTVVVFRWDTATYATSYTLDASRDSNNWVSLSGFPHFHGSGVNDTMDSTGGFVYQYSIFLAGECIERGQRKRLVQHLQLHDGD